MHVVRITRSYPRSLAMLQSDAPPPRCSPRTRGGPSGSRSRSDRPWSARPVTRTDGCGSCVTCDCDRVRLARPSAPGIERRTSLTLVPSGTFRWSRGMIRRSPRRGPRGGSPRRCQSQRQPQRCQQYQRSAHRGRHLSAPKGEQSCRSLRRRPTRRLDDLAGTDSVDEPIAERACRRQAGKGRSPIDLNARHGSKTIAWAVVRAGQARVMCHERHEELGIGARVNRRKGSCRCQDATDGYGKPIGCTQPGTKTTTMMVAGAHVRLPTYFVKGRFWTFSRPGRHRVSSSWRWV